MRVADFISVFGQLLSDGALRDALAANPTSFAVQLGLSESDAASLARIRAEDLEFQADVLLRKRLKMVRAIIPETCSTLGSDEWRAFRAYARSTPLPEGGVGADALGFCAHLKIHLPRLVSAAEFNLLQFVETQSRLRLHLARHRDGCGVKRRALQLLVRTGRNRCREFRFYLRF